MLNNVIYLITQTYTQNSEGQQIATETRRQVFCDVQSIYAREYYEAGRNGLAPDYKFVMFSHDYNGERKCEYNGQTYSIYRTFRDTTDRLELYVQLEGGTNE